tara:strand:+ start:521 stop:694 length:174 start_codon:yes stop_codon:yes gene_type:complete
MTDDEYVCSICASKFNMEEGGIDGYFGISPVTFCVWCLSSLAAMANDMGWCDSWEEE